MRMNESVANQDVKIAQLSRQMEDFREVMVEFTREQKGINDKLFTISNQNSLLLVKFEERICNHLIDHDKPLCDHLENHKVNDIKATLSGAVGGSGITALMAGIALLLKDKFGL